MNKNLDADLDSFYLEHLRCGELENCSPADGSRVVLVCSCGAVLQRAVTAADPPLDNI